MDVASLAKRISVITYKAAGQPEKKRECTHPSTHTHTHTHIFCDLDIPLFLAERIFHSDSSIIIMYMRKRLGIITTLSKIFQEFRCISSAVFIPVNEIAVIKE